MITEDYVSYETEKLLKEKGFYESVSRGISDILVREASEKPSYLQPTIAMAMKWLREKHKITIGILFKGDRIYYEIHQNNEFVFGVDTPESYEKVCDEAVKYCLKILIKNDTGRKGEI